MTALEIAVTSAVGACVALAGGADRVELCSALELGGITPSQGLVEAAVRSGIPVHVLIRCRPGDFVYDADEIALMQHEIADVLAAGAAGVVIGALSDDGTLDEDAVARLVDTARNVAAAPELTLHRAIDHAVDPVRTAAILPALGIDRVLTSGGAATAAAGRGTIARMVDAAPALQVMAGGGLVPSDIPALVEVGVAAVHLSAKRPAPSRARRAGSGGGAPGGGVALGSADSGAGHFITDAAVVEAARAAVTRE